MLPAQRNKVDVSKLTPAEQQAFRLYGKLPSRPVAKSQERKYFDSGDWALSKAGKQKGEYGKEIPTPDAIPHASPSPLVGGVSTPGGSSGTPGVGSPGSGISGMMSPPSSSSSSIGLGHASSTSPPGSFVIGNTGGTSPTGSSGLGQSNTLASAPGAVPIKSSSSSQGSNNNNNPVSLSMSPGRVGIGGSMGGPSMHSGTTSSLHHHGLATSPTRSFGSFPIAHNHNSSVHHHSYSSTSTSPTGSSANLGSNNTPSLSSSVGVGISIGGSNNSLSPTSHSNNTVASGNGIGIAGSAGNGGGSLLSGTSPMVSATTGNQIGKTQIRRTSQSEGTSYMNVLPAAAGVAASSNMGGSSTADLAMSPPPRSGLANSITPDSLMDDEEEDEGTTITPGARGEDEQVEGMELQ